MAPDKAVGEDKLPAEPENIGQTLPLWWQSAFCNDSLRVLFLFAQMALRKTAGEEKLPALLEKIEKILQGNGKKFACGDEISCVDVVGCVCACWCVCERE